MQMRKWSVLAATVGVVAMLATGFAFAQEDEKLVGVMEKVSAANNKINRAVRTKVTFTKANNGKDIAADAEELAKLGKIAKEHAEAKEFVKNAKGVENAEKQWNDLMDTFISSSTELAKASASGNHDQAKAIHQTVKGACADCHKVFRIEDDF